MSRPGRGRRLHRPDTTWRSVLKCLPRLAMPRKAPGYRAFLLPCPLRHKDLHFPSFAPEAGFFRSSMLTARCSAIRCEGRCRLKASQ